jgi:hypothetical protein
VTSKNHIYYLKQSFHDNSSLSKERSAKDSRKFQTCQ